MSRFFTKSLSALQPYTPGEQPQDMQYIKLNTNESPFPPSPRVLEAIDREEVSRPGLPGADRCHRQALRPGAGPGHRGQRQR